MQAYMVDGRQSLQLCILLSGTEIWQQHNLHYPSCVRVLNTCTCIMNNDLGSMHIFYGKLTSKLPITSSFTYIFKYVSIYSIWFNYKDWGVVLSKSRSARVIEKCIASTWLTNCDNLRVKIKHVGFLQPECIAFWQ